MKTDRELQQDVLAELKWEPKVNATNIGVEVKKGVVTLSGHVDSLVEKWNAEQAAKRVIGVKALAIELDVIVPGSSQKSDTEIAIAASEALKWNVYKLADKVSIKVEDGVVTLTGAVPWYHERLSAENLIRYLTGVRGVNNLISIKPSISINTVKMDIERALKRRAHEEAQQISVAIQGDEVILGGKIHNWQEKSLALDAVWGVPGVKKVIDHTTFV
jgi:osmotically-inducible protein OsmY